jgi:hypothetical protein
VRLWVLNFSGVIKVAFGDRMPRSKDAALTLSNFHMHIDMRCTGVESIEGAAFFHRALSKIDVWKLLGGKIGYLQSDAIVLESLGKIWSFQ